METSILVLHIHGESMRLWMLPRTWVKNCSDQALHQAPMECLTPIQTTKRGQGHVAMSENVLRPKIAILELNMIIIDWNWEFKPKKTLKNRSRMVRMGVSCDLPSPKQSLTLGFSKRSITWMILESSHFDNPHKSSSRCDR